MAPRQSTPKVVIETPLGDMTIELFPDYAPITVDNFLQYVNSNFYNGLIVHFAVESHDPNDYVIIEMGGYQPGGYLRTSGLRPPIVSEGRNGLHNVRGSLAMARSYFDANSAQSKFHINLIDHPYMDAENSWDGYGYCVFGQVISGLEVADAILALPTLPPFNGLYKCPYYVNDQNVSDWVYTYQFEVRSYVSPSGNDTTGLGSPDLPLKTIQKGIDIISEPGHVVVKPGTYTGAGNIDLDLKGKAITVRNLQPIDADTVTKAVIDCQANSVNKHRAFYFHTGEDANSVLQGFTILNGYHDYGGAIRCSDTSPTIKNCTIIKNNATIYGGGIYCYNGSPIIKNCTLSDNTAGTKGGALCYNYDCNSTLLNSILWDNTAPSGHEIALLGTSAKLALSYDDLQGGESETFVNAGSSITVGLGNLDLDPCFVDPCSNEFHLQSQRWYWSDANNDWLQGIATSPCIDAGNPGSPPSYEYGSTNVRINMGAEGATTKASIPPDFWQFRADLNNDGFVDLYDFAHFASFRFVSGSDLPGDLNRNKSVGIADLGLFSDDWLKAATWYWPEMADLNGDKIINFRDFSLLAENWLATGDALTGDLNGDKTVNGEDGSLLADVWLQSAR